MEKQKKGVRLEHISKIYKDPKTGKEFYAVQDTTLNIEAGTFVTLLGPSGCGKSTLLRCFSGLETVSEGEIYLDGVNITNFTPKQRKIGMVFQQYSLFPNMTVRQNVAFGLQIQKKEKSFKYIFNAISVFLLIIGLVYIFVFANSIANDIIALWALFLSIETECICTFVSTIFINRK